ncbi:hypothetical protein QOZ80_5BG0417300 [Eleusine coracana subsp. coracana]|nr:hypothetical protein QOZ80_5BG0417300 [Eleusine coracana subsp. coracana]
MPPLQRLSAAVSGRLRRGLSTAAAHPPWAMFDCIKLRPSSAQRASLELAAPPGSSHLVVPDHLIDLEPETPADPDSDILRVHVGKCSATSGDGLLLLDFADIRATAPVVVTHPAPPKRKLEGFRLNLHSASGATQERKITGYNLNPDVTRFVCNPITGQMSRLPDIDGTKKTSWGAVSADPFSDRPDLRFVELPKGRMLREPRSAEEITPYLLAQGMFRRMGVSEGRLRYVEVAQEEPFVVSSFTLDDDGCGWALEHQAPLCRPEPGADHLLPGQTPWIGAIDPLNASVVCVIQGDHVLAIDMDKREVLGHSYLGEK